LIESVSITRSKSPILSSSTSMNACRRITPPRRNNSGGMSSPAYCSRICKPISPLSRPVAVQRASIAIIIENISFCLWKSPANIARSSGRSSNRSS